MILQLYLISRIFKTFSLYLFQIHPNEPSVKWDYFRKVFERDRKYFTGKWCPNITKYHLDPSSMLKMRIILAVQVNDFIEISEID